jgi:hypothetical protein
MTGIYDKSVFPLRRGRESAKESFWRLHFPSAHLTDQVTVHLGCEVIGGRTVPQVRVNDDTPSFEFIEITVDGREMNIGRNVLNLFSEFFCGTMRTLFEEAAKQYPSRGRRATAAFAQKI